ncbi:MAG: hypothetical protein J0H85_13670 [Sediminibacterium magnilacihabitans]|nr:hypothetical protein [Sediminibacterium magnilacihabitans]PQV59478.1 hypothetical protein CLV53_11839 [Sediminibacterium magnilacihabitans]
MNEDLSGALSGALSRNTTQLVKAITPFSYEAFNCRPPEGGWTAGIPVSSFHESDHCYYMQNIAN